MGSRLAAVASLIVVGTVVSAQAPNRSVIEQYKMGVAAIEAAQWQDAVEPLKAALAIDAHARTYREGPFTGEYFPQYYLFVAYLKLNDVEQAQHFYALRGPLPQRLEAQANRYAAALSERADVRGAIPGASSVRAATIESMNQTRMLGDVTIVVNGVTLHADEAIYTPATRTVILKGAVTAVLPEAK